jgi:hypothetical protein
VLLDGGFLEVVFQRLDIGGDAQRLDVGELADTLALALVLLMGWTPPDGIGVPKWRCR